MRHGYVLKRSYFLNKVKNFVAIFMEFMRDYPSEFLILLIMLCIDGFIAAGSVLAVAPLADYLIDPSLHSPSSITQYIINFGKYFSIESGFVFFAGFFFSV